MSEATLWLDDVLITEDGDPTGVTITGDLAVTGDLSKGSGSFLIDHPLDPENKVLRHSFVESPEMMNLYAGRARLTEGRARISLPDYFTALNRAEDFRVFFTSVDGWSPLYLVGGIRDNEFAVRTTPEGDPSQAFHYLVSSVRDDPYARAHPILVEEEKGVGNRHARGRRIHPEAAAFETAAAPPRFGDDLPPSVRIESVAAQGRDQPDLDVLYISRSPRYSFREEKNVPEQGDLVTFTARVANRGAGSAQRVLCAWYVDEHVVREVSLEDMSAGETTSFSLEWEWRDGPSGPRSRCTVPTSTRTGDRTTTPARSTGRRTCAV